MCIACYTQKEQSTLYCCRAKLSSYLLLHPRNMFEAKLSVKPNCGQPYRTCAYVALSDSDTHPAG